MIRKPTQKTRKHLLDSNHFKNPDINFFAAISQRAPRPRKHTRFASPPPAPAPARQPRFADSDQYGKAIKYVPESTLRSIAQVFLTSTTAEPIWREELLTRGRKIIPYDGANPLPLAINRNQIVSRWTKCQNCKKGFDLTGNDDDACAGKHSRFIHILPSTLNSDEPIEGVKQADTFEFWEHRCLDPEYRMCNANVDGFQKGFIWSCCGRKGDNPGCKAMKHQSKENSLHIKPRKPKKDRRDQNVQSEEAPVERRNAAAKKIEEH